GQASAGASSAAKRGGVFDAVTSGSAFNPQISVILDGNYYQDDTKDGNGAELVGEAYQAGGSAGHAHGDDAHDHDDGGHAHNDAQDGFNFREAELSFSATVDPYFDAATYVSFDGDGSVELEEAYFETRALPYGLKVKGGKFLSDFGYINRQHPHQWDFVDQNLPYLNLLGFHGLQDTGLQLTWIPELPFYALIGGEALQGNQEIFGATVNDAEQEELNLGSTNTGPRLYTLFAKATPELGRNQALQFGLSYAHAEQQQAVQTHTHAVEHAHENEHEDEHEHDEEHEHANEPMHDHGDGITEELHETGLAGNADLWGIDLVYKYDAPGAYGQGDFTFQSEYLRSIKDMTVRSSAHSEQIGSARKYTTDGLYAQATYGLLPKWKAGLRYDVLGLTNKVSGARSEDFGSSDRWTVDVSWNLSEYSKLRAQYAYNDVLAAPDERERFNAFYLQFLMSLGSHGAHEF
ncbi:MAG: TonB-dependent receptor, partial [Thiohalocapsa sp.]